MRKLVLLLLILAPALVSAQLTNDGKSEAVFKLKSDKSSYPFSVLIAGNTLAPFGVKVQYCKSFGAYAAFKSDFDLIENHYYITAGAAKSLGKSVNLYLGAGLDLGYEEYDYGSFYESRDIGTAIETGAIFKIKNFTLDLGIGLMIEKWYYDYDEYSEGRIVVNFGLGFSF